MATTYLGGDVYGLASVLRAPDLLAVKGAFRVVDANPALPDLSGDFRYATIQAAVNAATAGDTIFIAPGSYDEAVTISKGIILVGVGRRGVVAIAPSATNATALTVTGDNVTIMNVGLEGDGTGGGLHLEGDVDRFRAYSSKIEGGAFAVKLESTAAGAVSDTRFEDCELCWTGKCFHFVVSGGGDPVTQTRIHNCHLHNYTTAGIHVDTVHTADLWVVNNVFARQEDGTEPTDYILANIASTTGFVAGNQFATATNATGVLTIASGVIWGPNGTEAGWSTARPA